MLNFICLMILAGALSAADLDNNTVTVTATRANSVQPDEAQITVQLIAPVDTGLDDVLAKLKGAGVAAANLSSVSVAAPASSEWTFTLTVPLNALKATMTQLVQLQRSLGPALTFYVSGAQVSADAQATQACPLTALLSDARKQADSLAAAAGLRAGPVISVSDQPLPIGVTVYDALTASPVISGVLVAVPAAFSVLPPAYQRPEPSCSLTVQFKLQ